MTEQKCVRTYEMNHIGYEDNPCSKENCAELKDKLNNLSKVAEVRLANWQKYAKELKEAKNHIHHLLVLLTEGKRSYAVIDEARAFLEEGE